MEEGDLVVVFVSNGPGELATWVKPLAEKLHSKVLMRPRDKQALSSLKLVLVPCPNATGNELKAAKRWGQFETIIPAKSFLKLLLSPNKFSNWSRNGLVVFLGGDQFWSVLLSARLKYKHLTYAEWVARWPQWNDHIAAMSLSVKHALPKRFQARCSVVGDLMADISEFTTNQEKLTKGKWIVLMPGSKKAKLSVGVPFFIEVVDHVKKLMPECNFILPVAPTTNLEEIKNYCTSNNPIARQYNSKIIYTQEANNKNIWKRFITDNGNEINLIEDFPAHNLIAQCDLALTTVGANTAELGALCVPMIVVLPTQHLSVMQAWDGLIGLLCKIPGFRNIIGMLIWFWRLRKKGFFAWPNISAGRMIVSERVGYITPKEIANEANDLLKSKHKLENQKKALKKLRGNPGAVDAMTEEIIHLMNKVNRLNK